MKKLLLCLIIMGSLIVILPNYIFAKAIPPEIGSIKTFASENEQYSVDIKILGYPDRNPSECSFKEGKKVIWSREIPTTPGKVNISNNGKSIVMADWGWYDEGGFKGLSFYDNKGELIKRLTFGEEGTKASVIWIDEVAISPDGKYYALGTHWADTTTTKLYLYDCTNGDLAWFREYISKDEIIEVTDIEICNEGELILMATYKYGTWDMLFTLLNKEGNILWQSKLKRNFSWDIKDYLHLDDVGKNFEIFDISRNSYIPYSIQDNKVIQK